ALVRTASTHVHRGDAAAALALCEDALILNPTPFDAAAVRAVRGYALVKSGDLAGGVAHLREALAFYEDSKLRYTATSFGLWLADAYLRQGAYEDADRLLERTLDTARQLGYRHVQGIAERLYGEVHASTDAADAAAHLDIAETILRGCDAANELAKV